MASGRNPFSEADDNLLAQYIARYNPAPIGRKGNKIYKDLVENADRKWSWSVRHTAQSWRDRYVKNQVWFDWAIKRNLKRKKQKADQEEREKRAAQAELSKRDGEVEETGSENDNAGGDAAEKQRKRKRVSETSKPEVKRSKVQVKPAAATKPRAVEDKGEGSSRGVTRQHSRKDPVESKSDTEDDEEKAAVTQSRVPSNNHPRSTVATIDGETTRRTVVKQLPLKQPVKPAVPREAASKPVVKAKVPPADDKGEGSSKGVIRQVVAERRSGVPATIKPLPAGSSATDKRQGSSHATTTIQQPRSRPPIVTVSESDDGNTDDDEEAERRGLVDAEDLSRELFGTYATQQEIDDGPVVELQSNLPLDDDEDEEVNLMLTDPDHVDRITEPRTVREDSPTSARNPTPKPTNKIYPDITSLPSPRHQPRPVSPENVQQVPGAFGHSPPPAMNTGNTLADRTPPESTSKPRQQSKPNPIPQRSRSPLSRGPPPAHSPLPPSSPSSASSASASPSPPQKRPIPLKPPHRAPPTRKRPRSSGGDSGFFESLPSTRQNSPQPAPAPAPVPERRRPLPKYVEGPFGNKRLVVKGGAVGGAEVGAGAVWPPVRKRRPQGVVQGNVGDVDEGNAREVETVPIVEVLEKGSGSGTVVAKDVRGAVNENEVRQKTVVDKGKGKAKEVEAEDGAKEPPTKKRKLEPGRAATTTTQTIPLARRDLPLHESRNAPIQQSRSLPSVAGPSDIYAKSRASGSSGGPSSLPKQSLQSVADEENSISRQQEQVAKEKSTEASFRRRLEGMGPPPVAGSNLGRSIRPTPVNDSADRQALRPLPFEDPRLPNRVAQPVAGTSTLKVPLDIPLPFATESPSNPFLDSQPKGKANAADTRRHTITGTGETNSTESSVPKVDLRIQLSKSRFRRQSLPIQDPSKAPLLQDGSASVSTETPETSRRSSPASLAASDKDIIAAAGEQHVISIMAAKRGFHEDVVRKIWKAIGNLRDTDAYLREMQIECAQKTEATFSNLDAWRSKRTPSLPGSAGSDGKAKSDTTHAGTDTSRRRSRSSGNKFTPLPLDDDGHESEYTPPVHSRAGRIVRLSKQGRLQEALEHEGRVASAFKSYSSSTSRKADTVMLSSPDDDGVAMSSPAANFRARKFREAYNKVTPRPRSSVKVEAESMDDDLLLSPGPTWGEHEAWMFLTASSKNEEALRRIEGRFDADFMMLKAAETLAIVGRKAGRKYASGRSSVSK